MVINLVDEMKLEDWLLITLGSLNLGIGLQLNIWWQISIGVFLLAIVFKK
jgi:hypothetical protein